MDKRDERRYLLKKRSSISLPPFSHNFLRSRSFAFSLLSSSLFSFSLFVSGVEEVGGGIEGDTDGGAVEAEEDEGAGVSDAFVGGVAGGEGRLYTKDNQMFFFYKREENTGGGRRREERETDKRILSSARLKTCKKGFRKVSI